MNNDRSVIFALGLAQKAGKIASGDFAVKSALKGGKVKLLIIASDASDNSKKDIYYLAGLYSVKTIEILDREQLGMAIGKAKRTAIAVLDANFANMMSGDIFAFPTCGVAGFQVDCESWADFEGAKKKLLFFYEPKKI